MVYMTDVTGLTVHLCQEDSYYEKFCLGGGRMKSGTRVGGKLSGFEAVWLGSWVGCFNLHKCPDAL